jgi:hypothetical protein
MLRCATIIDAKRLDIRSARNSCDQRSMAIDRAYDVTATMYIENRAIEPYAGFSNPFRINSTRVDPFALNLGRRRIGHGELLDRLAHFGYRLHRQNISQTELFTESLDLGTCHHNYLNSLLGEGSSVMGLALGH